ncbi:MAG TPA: 3-hydroxyacyl-CoA dehydrogenase/enoyl-CoA hydratase family protein [Syntrophales bacterium]|nr:3-hydroxyacyl-CoA dehydrogenase/enoyl-CoA hydratase family protein [Syntrophales bacterium]HOM07678.1 3-hydroxyacyl-CoA dehydrogenase/enoyl-CoA hydratase family protein [Syntrophales bacterium]HOO00456.1 3-hydroxyacyl-CoA dehydrogenase/enoyl-CoA hydratase family protein [Syntrophales bacterium]HPC00834.1 3-hydroxyacyl-CoA dehydrogenase/enoyl-CoA hydratase family protein [Syntrophales bacterium]HPQ07399.1 3-hydroxyacyl-CoA dehydrogenase/enoyl-CoA hydratase family protein [Syntrophales bacteri
MAYEIKKAAVLGAGVMGATIAAHLTNAGIPCYLLDIVPFELTEADKKKGLTEQSKEWRNRFAANGLAGVTKAKPAAFYSKKNASMITIGNFEDDLGLLADVDWVIEVVVENLKIKQDLLAKVEKVVKPTCIVSTNTSGIPIKDISAKFGASLKKRFLGTHFFNPPRYMKLLEIIPGKETDKEVVDFMVEFGERVLGKGVVVCKDVPNFVGNRIGVYDISNAVRLTMEKGLKIDEVDAIISKAIGRPGSAIYGTLDLVGLDTGYHVMKNLYEAVPDDEARDMFVPAPFMDKMMELKWLGNKTKQGFYKKTKDAKGKKVKLMLDYEKMEYVPAGKPKFDSIAAAKKLSDLGPAATIKAVFFGEDKAAELVREYLCNNFIYAANRIPEICDNIVAIDNAMKWGYNHALGPFETWDAVGVKEAVEVMKKLKKKVPKKVEEMLKKGFNSFYLKKEDGLYYYDFDTKDYVKIGENPRIILLPSLKERNKVVASNPGATLVDIGDGVVCLEFHTKMNAVDDNIVTMIEKSCDIVEKDFVGMVVGNHAPNFSAGANIFKVLTLIQLGDWDILEKMVADFQNANMRMKYLSKPVVTAPAGLALGGGCEMAMHGAKCQPCGETYIGLVEVGVGVIPAGGGCKEMMVRVTEGIPDGAVEAGLNLQTFYGKAFENIGTAKVATSAMEAMELGFIRKTDGISLNRDHQIWDAKQVVLGLAKFYKKPRPVMIPVMGENFRGMAEAILYNMRHGNFATDYDVHIGRKLAYILSGGDCAEGTFVTEQEILDLEREAFLSLCGEKRTQDRIMHMLTTGKPLRN